MIGAAPFDGSLTTGGFYLDDAPGIWIVLLSAVAFTSAAGGAALAAFTSRARAARALSIAGAALGLVVVGLFALVGVDGYRQEMEHLHFYELTDSHGVHVSQSGAATVRANARDSLVNAAEAAATFGAFPALVGVGGLVLVRLARKRMTRATTL